MIRLVLTLLLVLTLPAFAVEPEEVLDDPALEARARALSLEVRCVVCQNQSIDDSPAQIAADMRRAIRERLVAGDSDEQVLTFLVDRYGDYVLLRPPFRPSTYFLWFGPGLVLLIGVSGVVWSMRRRSQKPEPDPLTPEEREAVNRILNRPSGSEGA
ncbi:MAG: cytochrome c-type biogenesis protein [Pseudomonadota bacterium]